MLKRNFQWKKFVFFVVLLIVSIRIFYIMERGEIAKQYYTSDDVDVKKAQEIPCSGVIQKFWMDSDRLKSIEVIFNGIVKDESGKIVLAIKSGDELIYRTTVSLKKLKNLEWKRIFINMPVEHGKEYELYFDSWNCKQVPSLLLVTGKNSPTETIGSIFQNINLDKNIAVKFGYMREPTLFDRMLSSVMWIVFFVLFTIFLMNFEKIKNWILGISAQISCVENLGIILIVVELFFCMIILTCSKIKFQEFTKIIFYLISIVSTWNLKKSWGYIAGFFDKSWKKVVLCLLCFYGAFALVGQRILIYPLNLRISFHELLVFFITMIWFLPVIVFILYWFDHISLLFVSDDSQRMKKSRFLVAIFVFLLVPAALNLYANNPGITSWDTGDCMAVNAHNLKGMYDWHPFFYCLVLKIILTVWDSTYAVIFVQYFFWIYVMSEGLLYLRKKGMKDNFLLIIAFLAGINAANFLHINTIWKDIPYGLSALWTMILLAKLVLDSNEYKRKWYIYLELIIAMTGVYFYRKNGIVTLIAIVFVLLFMLQKNIKIVATLTVMFVIILAVKGPVYSYFEVENPGRSGMYIGLSQDILGVYYAGGEVSKETVKMINIMTGYTNAEYEYMPTWAMQTYDLVISPIEFIKSYVDTFIKNPITMTRAIVARQDAIWDIFVGKDAKLGCVNWTSTVDEKVYEGWSDYYPARKYNSFNPWMNAFTAYTADNQLLNALGWRCGIVMLLLLISLFWTFLIKGNGRYMIICVPMAGHILSLMLSTGWADFRYYWPINLMGMFILLIEMVHLHDSREGSRL